MRTVTLLSRCLSSFWSQPMQEPTVAMAYWGKRGSRHISSTPALRRLSSALGEGGVAVGHGEFDGLFEAGVQGVGELLTVVDEG